MLLATEPRLTPANRQVIRSVKTSKLMIYDQKSRTCKYFVDINEANSDTIWWNVPGGGCTALQGTFGSRRWKAGEETGGQCLLTVVFLQESSKSY